jgi:hypothetical protein
MRKGEKKGDPTGKNVFVDKMEWSFLESYVSFYFSHSSRFNLFFLSFPPFLLHPLINNYHQQEPFKDITPPIRTQRPWSHFEEDRSQEHPRTIFTAAAVPLQVQALGGRSGCWAADAR